jgi:endoribonuclease Dicer
MIIHRLQSLKMKNIKKSIAFITPTKVLVGQQCEYISQRIEPLGHKVNSFTGECLSRGHHIDNWPASEWKRQIDEYDVMIFIPEIFRHALQHALIHVASFDSVILDECHHAIGKHPMNVICTMLKESGNINNYSNYFFFYFFIYFFMYCLSRPM